jgi:hypothetical protein
MDWPSEISQFYDIVDKHYVLRLKISVDDIVAMEVDQCFYSLRNVIGWLDFREKFLLSQLIEKRGFAQLEYEVKIGALLVVSIKL